MIDLDDTIEPYGRDAATGRPPRRDGPTRWGTLLIAVAMFAAGLVIGWLLSPNGVVGDMVDTAAPAASTTTPTTATPAQPRSGSAADVETAPPLDEPSTDEPVSDVADALLPSVVQIQLPLQGLGSGVIYAPDGRILTAAHVVQGADQVTVILATGEKLTGTVLGADTGNDVAVVTVDRNDLAAAPLALDETPRVGQMAVALGSPWGLDSTVTAGVVSAVNQTVPGPDGLPHSMLQTDAPINPGNSGGPLADRHGRVIGINVSIYSQTGANAGVGFAVPIDRAFAVAESILTGEDFPTGYLGVSGAVDDENLAGGVIGSVGAGTPADEAGLEPGDRVISVDGVPVSDWYDVVAQIKAHQAGDTIELTFVRDGEETTTQVTLTDEPG